MKTATKVIFTSALMLSVVAPSLSYAAYFVDQTKTWATRNACARCHGQSDTSQGGRRLKRKFQGNEALNFMAPATRQYPERVLTRTTRPRSQKYRRDRQRLLPVATHANLATTAIRAFGLLRKGEG